MCSQIGLRDAWIRERLGEGGSELLIELVGRDAEGWRDYPHGTDITTRHDDHLHVTIVG